MRALVNLIVVIFLTLLTYVTYTTYATYARYGRESYAVQCATTNVGRYLSTWVRGENPYDQRTDKLFLTNLTLKECFGWDLTADYHVALLQLSTGGVQYLAYSPTEKVMCTFNANQTTLGACSPYWTATAVDTNGYTHTQLHVALGNGEEVFTQLVLMNNVSR
jgi:hypothetical protein